MRRLWPAALASSFLVVAGPAQAQFSLGPDWAERPSPESLAPGYPELPRQLMIEGFARVRCEVAANGVPQDCVVEQESPEGLGFGASARMMAPSFEMRPALQPGARNPDTTVRIPISFRLPPRTSRPSWAALDERRAQLADELAAAADPAAAMVAHYRLTAERLKAQPGRGVEKDVAEAAAQAIVQAAERVAPRAQREALDIVAGELRPAELESLIAFARSPVGRRFLGARPERIAAFEAVGRRTANRQRFEARAALCAKLACDVTSPDLQSPFPDRAALAEMAAPRWQRYPSPAEQYEAWPFARLFGVSLVAMLTCGVGPQGAPEDCTILAASPAALGAKDAALALAAKYRMDSEALPTIGGKRVLLTVLVVGAPPRTPEPAPAEAAADRLARAKQIFDARAAVDPPPLPNADDMRRLLANVEPAVRPLAEAALQHGHVEAKAAYRREWAEILAQEFTEPELRQVLAFQTGAGSAMQRAYAAQRERLTLLGKVHSEEVADQARAIFCAARRCQQAPPPQPAAANPEPSTRNP